MSDPMDYYGVQKMVHEAVDVLRHDVYRELAELRDAIGDERVDRQAALESLQAVLDARTERFV